MIWFLFGRSWTQGTHSFLPFSSQRVLSRVLSATGWGRGAELSITAGAWVDKSNSEVKNWQAHLTSALKATSSIWPSVIKLTYWSPYLSSVSSLNWLQLGSRRKVCFFYWSYNTNLPCRNSSHMIEFWLLRLAHKVHFNLSSSVIHKVRGKLLHLYFPPCSPIKLLGYMGVIFREMRKLLL